MVGTLVVKGLKDKMSSISSDLYEETFKLNKSHTNRIMKLFRVRPQLKNQVNLIEEAKYI